MSTARAVAPESAPPFMVSVPLTFVSTRLLAPPVALTVSSVIVPPVPLKLIAVAEVAVRLASLRITPVTAPPASPVLPLVEMLRPRTVLLVLTVTVFCTVGRPSPVAGRASSVPCAGVDDAEQGVESGAHALPDQPAVRRQRHRRRMAVAVVDEDPGVGRRADVGDGRGQRAFVAERAVAPRLPP